MVASNGSGADYQARLQQAAAQAGDLRGFAFVAPQVKWNPEPAKEREQRKQAEKTIENSLSNINSALISPNLSESQRNELMNQKSQLEGLQTQLQNGAASLGSQSFAAIASQASQIAGSVAGTVATVSAGGSMAGQIYTSQQVQQMHQRLYNSDPIYRQQSEIISQRANERIVQSDSRDKEFGGYLQSKGIRAPMQDEIDREKKKRDDAQSRGDLMGARDADVLVNKLRMEQIQKLIDDEGKKPESQRDHGILKKFEAEKAKRQEEFERSLRDREEQFKKLQEARDREMQKKGESPERRQEELGKLRKRFDAKTQEFRAGGPQSAALVRESIQAIQNDDPSRGQPQATVGAVNQLQGTPDASALGEDTGPIKIAEVQNKGIPTDKPQADNKSKESGSDTESPEQKAKDAAKGSAPKTKVAGGTEQKPDNIAPSSTPSTKPAKTTQLS